MSGQDRPRPISESLAERLTRSLTPSSQSQVKLQEGQTFLSLYLDPGSVEYAEGGAGGDEKWLRETKKLGQVPTPALVAALMARWVMSARPDAVLDPAAGLGVLLDACARADRDVKLVGVEMDAATFCQAKQAAPQGTKLILADYLFSESGAFAGIIANPPYVKSQRMAYSEAQWRYFDERFGGRIDRLTNLYALFLLKIWDDLAPGGRAAVLIPAEFMNANFGTEIKERLVRDIKPRGVIVFAPELNLFDDALTTSSILFLERSAVSTCPIRAVKASVVSEAETFVDSLLSGEAIPVLLKEHDLRDFEPQAKWLNILLRKETTDHVRHLDSRIGDYFSCRRGIATGANDFFCLNKTLLSDHKLTDEHIEPCVTKATDVRGIVFTAEKLGQLTASDRRAYLLNPRSNGTELDAYLRVGELQGIPQRHLPSHRPVWYRPENRAVADIWVAVFSRETIKFILNSSGAKNLTCFHGLYARHEDRHLAPLLVLFLNSSWGRIAFSQVNRFYGDGLNKLEPKDVEDMPCPVLPAQTAEAAKALEKRLIELEQLPEDTRLPIFNAMASELLGLPFLDITAVTSTETSPAGSPPRRVKSPRRVAPRKRRAAQAQ